MHLRRDEGPRDAPVAVLLHGQPGSAGDWARVLPLLSGTPVRLLVVDRPGYGASTAPPADWAGNSAQLLALLDRLGVDRAALVGFSWGGGVALRTALDAPERVGALALVASVGHALAVGPADRLLAAPGVRRLWEPVMHRLGGRATRLLGTTSGSRLDPQALAWFRAEAGVWPATGAWASASAEQVSMVRDAESLSAALPGVATPAVVVHGWRDAYVGARAAVALAAALPQARFVPVDGGHLLPVEAPEAVAAAVRDAVALL